MFEKLRQKLSGRKNATVRHSHYYHSYYEGYAERRKVDEDGRISLKRVYVAPYYHRVEKSGGMAPRKVCFGLLLLTAFMSYLLAGILDTVANVTVYMIFFQTLMMLVFLWLGYYAIIYLSAAENMKVRTYRALSEKLTLMLQRAFLLSLGTDLSVCVYMALSGNASFVEISCLAANLLCSAVLFALYHTEKYAKYDIVLNPVKADPREVVIDLGVGAETY